MPGMDRWAALLVRLPGFRAAGGGHSGDSIPTEGDRGEGAVLQTGIVSEEAARIARDGGLAVVMDTCMGVLHGRLGLGPARTEAA